MATIDGRNLIFVHKLHTGTPYRGKRFVTHQIPAIGIPMSTKYAPLFANMLLCAYEAGFLQWLLKNKDRIR
jgi:hypothetical protein